MDRVSKRFYEIVGEEHVREQEPMKKHTTFRVGGPARYYVCPHSVQEIQQVIRICREEALPLFVLGNGSNLLVSDSGYEDVILQLFRNYNDIVVEENEIRAQAGALLSQIANKALEHGLGGFEFAAGIPGTLGGAAVMNAGAYGGEMKQVLKQVVIMDREGEVRTLQAEELHLGYRSSIIKEKDYIVLEAVISLEEKKKEEIQALMEELRRKRTEKQPLEYPSAGSTFKRPEGYFAGKLIMDAGLRGYSVGGACVSEKHCGFVINKGGATAEEVYRLMQEVRNVVHEKFDVWLEPEVKLLGTF